MRLHCIQHVPFEGPAAIRSWAEAKGFPLETTRLHAEGPLPTVGAFDWLIVMGGPMSVGDQERFPWLGPEKALIRSAVDADRRVLGVCLGAQLIAAALGEAVYPNRHREIGWFEVRKRPEADGHPLADRFPDRLMAFHWHGDTFDLPEGAVHLAESTACRHQAFGLGRRVLGLQFHLETTPESLEALIANCADEITEAAYVQRPEAMRGVSERFAGINRTLNALLDAMAEA